MHAEYFRRRMDLLVGRLEPGERVLARGRAFEPPDPLRFDLSMVIGGPGCVVAVTERRVLWVGREDQRWVRSLPFALVRSYTEITQAHRYALALDHQRIDRVRWVPCCGGPGAPPRRFALSPAACWRLAVATPRRRARSGVGSRPLASRPASHTRCPSTGGPVRCRLGS
jgi:hypothetical protein